MNKSLILVMCDVLVLSAMSLSSGGFGEGERREPGERDVTGEYAAAKNELRIAKENEIKARNEAEAARKGEEIAKRDKELALAGQKHAQDEADKAKEGQRRAEESSARYAAVAAAARAAADNADKARKDAEAKASKAQEEATAAKEGEIWAKGEAEAAKANEAHAKTEAEKAKAGQARAEKGKADADAAAAAAEKARVEIDDRFGKPARARQERIDRIHASACLVVVKFGKGKEDRFYSPVVDIDGEAYVMARYDGDKLALINSVSVQDRHTGATIDSREAYYLRENRQLDIVFFKLNTSAFSSRLTLGENSSETLQYWISRKNGAVKRAALVHPGLRQATSDYKTIEPGDVLVDSGTASIVCLALSKGTVIDVFNAITKINAKGAYGFDHKITYADLCFWRAL